MSGERDDVTQPSDADTLWDFTTDETPAGTGVLDPDAAARNCAVSPIEACDVPPDGVGHPLSGLTPAELASRQGWGEADHSTPEVEEGAPNAEPEPECGYDLGDADPRRLIAQGGASARFAAGIAHEPDHPWYIDATIAASDAIGEVASWFGLAPNRAHGPETESQANDPNTRSQSDEEHVLNGVLSRLVPGVGGRLTAWTTRGLRRAVPGVNRLLGKRAANAIRGIANWFSRSPVAEGATTGTAFGLGAQGVDDYARGEVSGWESYARSGLLGGMLGGGLGWAAKRLRGEPGKRPAPAKDFKAPTNAAQPAPTNLPKGHYVRVMPPTEQYPHGYWIQYNQRGQRVNPATGKPPSNVSKVETRAQTHVPLPPPKGG